MAGGTRLYRIKNKGLGILCFVS